MPPSSRRSLKTGLLFASPFLVGFVLFTLYPLLANLFVSFTEYHVGSGRVFRGLGNYTDLARDPVFSQALWNTLVFTFVSVPVTILVALGLALLLNLQPRGKSFYTAVFLLPALVPAVAAAVLWRWVFPYHSWLHQPDKVKTILILMSVWGAGANMVLYLAAMRGVPQDLYDAADVEGANAWGRAMHVTLPAIAPVLFFTCLVGVIGGFQIFAQPYLFSTALGSHRAAPFSATYLFNTAFLADQPGHAAAMSWVLFLVLVVGVAVVLLAGQRLLRTK